MPLTLSDTTPDVASDIGAGAEILTISGAAGRPWIERNAGRFIIVPKGQGYALLSGPAGQAPGTHSIVITDGVTPVTATLTVSDAADSVLPVMLSRSSVSVIEGQAIGVDLRASKPVTWSLRAGADGAEFTLTGNRLSLGRRPWSAAKNVYVANVRGTDAGGNQIDSTVTVNIMKRQDVRPGGPESADQDRYLYWATGMNPMQGNLYTAQSGANYFMTKLVVGSPQYAINNLRFHFAGFASTNGGNSPQETILPGNDTVIDGFWISVNGGPVVPCKFGGNAGVTIASGSAGQWTDNLRLDQDIPPEAQVTLYTLAHCAVGEKHIPGYAIEEHRGERVWAAGSAAELVALIGTDTASTAALMTTYTSANPQGFYGPDASVAKGWDGRPVALVLADSIGDRQTDAFQQSDARRNKGWLRRWLDKRDPTWGRVPHYVIGMPGASSTRELATSATLRWDIIDQIVAFNGNKRPFTCILNQMGRNDYQSTYSTMRADWKALNTRVLARHPGTRIVAVEGVVHPNSTDGFRTVANQGYQVGGEWPSGNRYQLEADKKALMDGQIQDFIEVIKPVGLDVLQGKWPAPFFITSFAEAYVGGTSPTIVLKDKPRLGEFLHLDAAATPAGGTVIAVSGTGPYQVTLNSTPANSYSVGSEVYAPNANDGSGTPRTGTHPRHRMIMEIANKVPQSGKRKLAA